MKISFPKIQEDTSFRGTYFFLFEVISALIIAILMYLIESDHHKLYEYSQKKLKMIQAINGLRQNSDELTYLAQMYIVSKNSDVKERYDEKLRTLFNPFYRSFSFTEAELQKIDESKTNFEILIKMEAKAFDILEGKDRTSSSALDLLFSSDYHRAKYQFMNPIDECMLMLEKRSNRELKLLHSTINARENILYFMMGCYIIGNLLLFRYLKRTRKILMTQKMVKDESLRKTLALKAGTIGIWEWDFATNTLIWDDIMYDIYGIASHERENPYTMWSNAVNPDDKPQVEANLHNALDTNGEYNASFWITTPSGERKFIHAIGVNELDEEGKPYKMVGVNIDISDQQKSLFNLKQKEEEVMKTNTLLDALLQSIPDLVWMKDVEGKYITCNRRFEEFFGATKEEIAGKTDYDYVSRELADFFRAHDRKAMEADEPLSNYEEIPFASDGHVEYSHTTKSQVRDAFGNIIGIMGIARDITDERNREASYRDLFNSVLHAMYVQDLNGHFIDVNNGFIQMHGFEKEEVLGKTVELILASDKNDMDEINRYFEAAKNGVSQRFRFWAKDKYGHEFPKEVSIIRAKYLNKDAIIAVGIDISEAEFKKQEFETIFKTTKDGLAILDLQNNFIEFNNAYMEMMGYDREELLKRSCIGMSIPEDVERAKNVMEEVIEHGYRTNFEKSCFRKDGSIVTINMALALMPDKEHILISTRDVTVDRELQMELLKAKETAERAAETKSAFLANMSHEIRTPLNGVIGLNALLLKTPLNERQSNYAKKSLQSANALLGIINDILDYSKIEAGKLELSIHLFSLEELLRSTAELFEHSVLEKNIELHIDYDGTIPQTLEGDTLRLSQIMNNLVGNAVKFTEKGDVTIRTKLLETNGDTVYLRISVTDSGIGMSEAEIAKLFHSFTQTDASNTRKYGGSGLGLVITKQLVEMMEGTIWVESLKGEGSTFYFTVMLTSVQKQSSSPSLEPFKNRRFLVVEDNALEREMIAHILESWGVHPILCSNGEEALAIADKTHIDYLLVDWKMPGLDGLDVIEGLADHHIGNLPKIIMISALLREDLVQKVQERHLHPDFILHKPITPSILLEALIDKEEQLSLKTEENEPGRLCYQGTILLAEDNEVNQLVAHDLLESFGVSADIANNGAEAIEMCRAKRYDLILMDLQMPQVDGFEAARTIRTFDKDIPIIALSAAAMQQDKELTSEAGMNEHLAKPIDVDELNDLLSRYLRPSDGVVCLEDKTSIKPIEGIDTVRLEKLFQSESKILGFLKTFAHTQRNVCHNLQKEPIGSEPFKAMIHSLKGVSGNIAAFNVHQLCINIEASSDEGEIAQLIEALCRELENVIEKIDAYIEAYSQEESSSVPLSKEEVLALLDSILGKIKGQEFIDADARVMFIQAIKSYATEDNTVSKIDEALDLFDFQQADLLIREIKGKIDA